MPFATFVDMTLYYTGGSFGHNRVEILVCQIPTGYMCDIIWFSFIVLEYIL